MLWSESARRGCGRRSHDAVGVQPRCNALDAFIYQERLVPRGDIGSESREVEVSTGVTERLKTGLTGINVGIACWAQWVGIGASDAIPKYLYGRLSPKADYF